MNFFAFMFQCTFHKFVFQAKHYTVAGLTAPTVEIEETIEDKLVKDGTKMFSSCEIVWEWNLVSVCVCDDLRENESWEFDLFIGMCGLF